MPFNAIIQFLYDMANSKYDVYFSMVTNNYPSWIISGGERETLRYEIMYQNNSTYLRLVEGASFEVHIPDPIYGYHKAVYTASGGSVTATLEKDISATIQNMA